MSATNSSRRRWWIVAVASFGLSTSPGQFAYGAFSLFIEPLEQEFGWARADMSLALTLSTLCLAVTLPFMGRLVDRHGSRRVLAPSMLVLGVGLCVLGWTLPGSRTTSPAIPAAEFSWQRAQYGVLHHCITRCAW